MGVYLNADLVVRKAYRHVNASYGLLNRVTRDLVTDVGRVSVVPTLSGRLRGDIAAVRAQIETTEAEIDRCRTADAALVVIADNLGRMRQLADGAFSGGHTSEELTEMDAEYQELVAAVRAAVSETTYGGEAVLSGSDPTATVNLEAVVNVSLLDVPTDLPGNLSAAILDVGLARADLAAGVNRMVGGIDALQTHAGELLTFQSRIASFDAAMSVVASMNASLDLFFQAAMTAQSAVEPDSALHLLDPTWED